jgi:hypothetical protein
MCRSLGTLREVSPSITGLIYGLGALVAKQ